MGLKGLISHRDEVIRAERALAERALEKCGIAAEGFAKKKLTEQKSQTTTSPVTGNLRASITHVVQDGEVYVGTNVRYAIYVEMGTGSANYPGGRGTPWAYQDINGNWHWTRGQKAKPFLKPAAAEHGEDYKEIIRETLQGR